MTETVRVRRVELVDAAGQVVAVLGTNAAGSPFLNMFNPGYGGRVLVTASSAGPVVMVADGETERQVRLDGVVVRRFGKAARTAAKRRPAVDRPQRKPAAAREQAPALRVRA